nr:AAA family ATPase [Neosynechococcus sphagnicola]
MTISVWNQKGGVGKTTNTVNIGATLAMRGKRVLLIDLDPQTDLTQGLGINPDDFSDQFLSLMDQVALKDNKQISQILKDLIQRKQFPTTEKKLFWARCLTWEQGCT